MGCAGRKGWPQDVGVSRGAHRIFPSSKSTLKSVAFGVDHEPAEALLAVRIGSRLGWIQAGPHASGCDEPGQIGRSSPKSFLRVPWSARPLLLHQARSASRTRPNAVFDSKREAPCPRAERVGDSHGESIHGEPQTTKPRSGFAVVRIDREGTDDRCAFGLASRIGTGLSPPGSATRPTQVAHMASRPLVPTSAKEAKRQS